MSFVGPRPERPEFVGELTQADSVLRPAPRRPAGLTGWAQVRYTYGASVEDALQKLQYDLFYIKNLSIALDLFIIFSTRSRPSCCGKVPDRDGSARSPATTPS